MGLIGRSMEVGAAEGVLEDLDGPSAMAIAGEPGIGKTRLVTEICGLADRRGYLVLNGRSAEFERELPFGALTDALDDYLASLPPRRFQPLGDDRLTELAQVFPSLSDLGGTPVGPQDERYRTHAAVRELLALLASEKPVVLALDDLHWADTATEELVAHLLRRPPSGAVCLVIAHRSGQLAPRLAGALEDARRQEAVVSIDLAGLSREEADVLLDEIDPIDRAGLYRLSGGNPFYLEELARNGGNGNGAAASVSASGVEVPERVAAALARELEELSGPQAEVARGAAVAGETFEPEVAAEAAGVGETEALTVIDELLDLDLMRTTDVPRRFRFRHPIVHSAVYESAKPGWRLAAHGRAANLLERRGASALARARHIECSAKPGDVGAVVTLTEAGQAAHPRAPAAAAHWYGAALRLTPDEDTQGRIALMVPMAQALGYAGRLDQARAALKDLLDLLGPEHGAVRGQVVAAAARIDQLLGNHQAALELLTESLEELSDRSSPEATELKVQLAGTCFFTGDFDGLRKWVAQALAEATERGDESTRAAVTGTLGCAEYMVGNLDAARERLDEAERALDQLSEDQVAGRLHSIVWCGMTEAYLGRFDRAIRLFDSATAVAQATGHGHVTTLTRIGRALVHLWQGELDEAMELLDAAAEQASLVGNHQFLTWALWARCWAATLAGDTPGALRFGSRAIETAAGSRNPISAMAGCYLAEAKLDAGDDPIECRELLIESFGGDGIPLVERAFRPNLYELLTRAELAAGQVEAAAGWTRLAREAAEGLDLDGRSADALRARAAVALALDDPEGAAEAALESIQLAERAGLPIDAAKSRILAGRALASLDRDEAIAQLERARSSLDAIGATRYRDEAASELRNLGRRVSRPKRGRRTLGNGIDSLSAREREVAALVAEGHTNKEIASELYLSEKTIESHLSRIFEKLGASKRAQVAAAMQREREPAAG